MVTGGFLNEGTGQPSQSPAEPQGTREAFIAAIYGQESNGGRADTSHVNSQGVTGPMQVQRETFDGMKLLGQIPEHADFNNPNHTKRAGEIHAGYLYDKHEGKVTLAAAEYYGGPKAVKNGSIVVFGNRKHPDHPTTMQYAQEISSRMRRATQSL